MKCPACNITCSNLRDLCPGCYVDLREHKRKSGIPVTNPKATYEELLLKVKRNFPQANIEASYPTTSQVVLESAETQESTVPAPSDTNGSREKTILEELLQEFNALPSLRVISTQLESPKPKRPRQIDAEEVSELFDFAYLTLSQQTRPREVELSIFELQKAKSSEDVVLYFELAKNEIENPESVRKLTSDIAFSEKAKVEATNLEKELFKVTKQLDAVVVSLKGDNKDKQFEKPAVEKIEELVEAPISLRVMGVSVDLLLTFMLGAAIGIGLELSYGTSHESSLVLIRSGDPVAVVSVIGAILSGSVLSVLLYQWACLFSLGRTVGSEIFSMRLVTETGAPVHASNRFVRGATFPLSVFALGFLPLFFGSRTVHDLASRTTLRKRILK